MNPLTSSSKWPSYNSLPSTSSIVLSESEQTEDETDISSEGEGDGGNRGSPSADNEISLSQVYLNFPCHAEELRTKSEHERSEFCPDRIKRPDPASSPRAATHRLSSATPGDLAFAQKCADLHEFIHPLLELLHGLKMGRFEKGLTSFQQSVAIDRLQRILGVLQKPEMGEKYLQNLTQIERLLKAWFPGKPVQSTKPPNLSSTSTPPPYRCQNQLHIPVKKRKLSWGDPDPASSSPTKQNRHQCEESRSHHTGTSLGNIATCLPLSHNRQNTPEKETAEPAGDECSAKDKFTDGAGPLRESSYLCSTGEIATLNPPEIPLPISRDSPVTQDCSVSSSDVTTTYDSL